LGLTYSQFMNGMTLAGIEVDRKVLSDIAVHDAAGFAVFVAQAKAALAKKAA
ncbi:MAG: 50S ribosomal protein L20, partial [Candidatus Pacebacteria bacterium]|nr:50S ribosomal protein L20 [Candidatus Paceibacterota bacterium]